MEMWPGNSKTSARSIPSLAGASVFLAVLIFCSCLTSTEAYGSQDPNGNITIKWDAMQWTPDGYVAVVTIDNFQRYRSIRAPGWRLGWTWAKNEVIWSIFGAKTIEKGDCSRFRGNIPSSCKKKPIIIDLPPNSPYNMQIANCCKGGVLNSWGSADSAASFQVTVGAAGTTNRTVKTPRNFTLEAPGARYMCGAAKIVEGTKFVTPDGRRMTQALMTWKVTCTYSHSLSWRTPRPDQPSSKVHSTPAVGSMPHYSSGGGS